MSSATPWTASYPAGMDWNAPLRATPVPHLLEDAAANWPERTALHFMGATLSYAQLNRLAGRAAAGLQALGVGPGVHVGLYLPNVPQYLIAFFGVLKAGGTVVNCSPMDARQALAHKIEDSHTDVLITVDLPALYEQAAPLLGNTRLRAMVVGSVSEYSATPQAPQGVAFGPQCLAFAQLLDNDGLYQVHPQATQVDTLAVLQYTGGTTGQPKGAMLTHANLSTATAQVVATNLSPALLHEGEERLLAALPLFHIYALVVNLLFAVRIGAEIVLMPRFDAGEALREISERRITCFPGVPTMFTALVGHPDVAGADLRSLKVCASGGAPLPLELLHRFRSLTGCTLTEAWGMTETAACGTFTPALGTHKPGACGIPQPGVTIRFLDPDDARRTLPMGATGEIAIHGPNIMAGYWNRPDATRESFTTDGFLRTGDVGHMDADGYLHIVDRTKDMLLCSGFNVYPRVIEEALYAHPGVEEALVIGIPDEYRGESPKAYITLRAGHAPFTLDELKGFLKDRLGRHEMVQALEFRDALPKTAVGKLSKKMLKDELDALRASAP